MSRKQLNFFESQRTSFNEQIALTVQSLKAYGEKYKHWAIAWSGGKDSTALVTLVVYLIESGQIPAPQSITVQFADTRMELTPLYLSAKLIMEQLRNRGIQVNVVLAPIDDRFFVYMFGRGVPPPSNTFRWCTPKFKVAPMHRQLQEMHKQTGEKFLLLTGVRQGESAQRDGRIAMSCGKDGAECGQGWYQLTAPEEICDKLAPILHWRVCSVWDWLKIFAPMPKHGGWPTETLADVYGGEEAEEKNARTGCIGCPLASKDMGLEIVCDLPEWAYLSPLKKLKPLYRELKKPIHRIRKTGFEVRKDGKLSKNQNRMGPLKQVARLWGLQQVLNIQEEINLAADHLGRPRVDLINEEEEARILELIEANTWPNGWDGTEQGAEEFFTPTFHDGSTQSDLFGK